jgi:hypothetical protein
LKTDQRIYEIDWLRATGVTATLIAHCSLVFGAMDWNIKSAQTSVVFNMVSGSSQLIALPLLVFLAGASVFLAMRKMSPRAFSASRAKRLLVPWALGVLLLSPIQVYLERVSQGKFGGSLTEFLPHYFEGFYGFGGNFAWMGNHLWFLLALFIVSMLFLPFFRRRGSKPALLEVGANRFNGYWLLGVMFLAAALPLSLIPPDTVLGWQVTGSWNLVSLVPFFIGGYMFYANPRGLGAMRRMGAYFLVAAVLATAALNLLLSLGLRTQSPIPMYVNPFIGLGYAYGSPLYPLSGALFTAASCLWLVSLWWLCDKWLNFSGRLAGYLRDVTMPFYILHQPVIMVIAFWITRWEIPMFPQFITVLVSVTGVCLVIYQLLIRNHPNIRVAFGIPARKPDIRPSGETKTAT